MGLVKTKISCLKAGDKWGRYTCKRQSEEGMHYVRDDGDFGMIHGCIEAKSPNYEHEVYKIINEKPALVQ